MSDFNPLDPMRKWRERSTLLSNELLVLVMLWTFCWGDNLVCFPGIDRLRQLTGLSRASIKRAIAGLAANGALTKKRRPKTGKDVGRGSTSNEYLLNPN